MAAEITVLKGGSVTSAKGFSAGSVFAGIKKPGPDKRDLGLIVSDRPCTAAGTFSKNTILSPSAVSSREVIRAGKPVMGVVANSGCANCAVGEHGLMDARETQALAAKAIGAKAGEVLICSTGVIGVELPMALIRKHIGTIKPSRDGGHDFSRAIMTTDTRPKEIAVSVKIGTKTATVGGCAKGAGMIHPNMATMLAFVTTDAAVDQAFLRKTLSEAVELSFNQIDVDSDMSTNDTVLLLANGAAGNAPLKGGDAPSRVFAGAVRQVCEHLAKEIARDGEGAKHLIECVIDGAKSDADARVMARSVVSSLLVKTAVYGRDPNWGRYLMAVGKTGIPVDESKIQVFVNAIQIVEGGTAIPFNIQSIVAALGEPEVHLRIALHLGKGTGVAWGSDLTEDYVVENSAYTT
jgi:glutamate N-acetyltransferase/amino-acid N-acetyltransferase